MSYAVIKIKPHIKQLFSYHTRLYQNLHVHFPKKGLKQMSFKKIHLKTLNLKQWNPRSITYKYIHTKKATKRLSQDFMFMPFMFKVRCSIVVLE